MIDRNLIHKNDNILDGEEVYTVIGALGSVLYIQKTHSPLQQASYQLADVEPCFRKIEYVKEDRNS
ncbi:MAG: hypothetical protein Q4F11_10095 [Eubacteriales bacterium]|nr:hypothetical protein [Eubacteriales bacterium]